jgi:hypothetical protein
LFGVMVSEVLVHGHLTALLGACVCTVCHDRRAGERGSNQETPLSLDFGLTKDRDCKIGSVGSTGGRG